MDNDELISTFYEVEPLDTNSFFKVRETLTRIGLANRRPDLDKPILWQSCHILHKRGHYYIVHFKQLFLLDGKHDKTNFTQEDKERTELVAHLLDEWGLVKLKVALPNPKPSDVVIISFDDKKNWVLKSKYTIGRNFRKLPDGYNLDEETIL